MSNKLHHSALSLAITASLFTGVLTSNDAQACSSEPMLGSMCVFAGNFAPRNWAFTDGQLLPINQNTALFSILGTTYGGDGRTTFALPDTRGRSVIGARQGPGLSSYPLGQHGGFETVTLTQQQIPTITPTGTATIQAQSSAGDSDSPSGNTWAVLSRNNLYSSVVPDVDMRPATIAIDSFGGGQAHENRSPFIALNWLIALQGIFPSRN